LRQRCDRDAQHCVDAGEELEGGGYGGELDDLFGVEVRAEGGKGGIVDGVA
jgi:hypothetical protein